ncbi:MAG TPA: cell division protein FtsZ [Candidatus Sulfotelmatobacter sp.]|nr:cell division protein FtsZ [Candidatus Sulfotelmatobacter sp.]
MGINLSIPATKELKPRIVVFGVGGAGGNAVNNMIGANLEGVEFVVANTDAQALSNSLAERRIQLGVALTQGLGAGARPDVGRAAAEEALDLVVEHLQGSHMAFITAGMGGGTGTGAAPVIARAAREMGILTVGVVTKPFQFEGSHRMRMAEAGIDELSQYVDTLIIIPNQNLFRIANEKTTFADAFKMADNVLHSGVRGVTDLMVMPGLINLDFADVRTVMNEMGKAMMGTGEAEGANRAIEAADAAIANPLLDDVSMKGAKGVLINITGGLDLTLYEVDEAANRIRNEVDPEANIIVGSTFDENLAGRMRVSVVATGIDTGAAVQPRPQPANVMPMIRPVQVRPISAGPSGNQAVAFAVSPTPVSPAPVAAQPAPQPVAQAARQAQAEAVQAPLGLEMPTPAPAAVAQPAPSAPVAEPAPKPLLRPTVDRNEPFIPPRPAEPEVREPPRLAEPQHEPALGGEGRARRPNLLERITRTGRARIETAIPTRTEPVAARPAAAAPVAKPVVKAPTLGGLEPPERVAAPREEDLLDIPAFLRRQAN